MTGSKGASSVAPTITGEEVAEDVSDSGEDEGGPLLKPVSY